MIATYDEARQVDQIDPRQLFKAAAKYEESLPQVGVSKSGGEALYFISRPSIDHASECFEQVGPEFRHVREDLLLGLWGSEK